MFATANVKIDTLDVVAMLMRYSATTLTFSLSLTCENIMLSFQINSLPPSWYQFRYQEYYSSTGIFLLHVRNGNFKHFGHNSTVHV